MNRILFFHQRNDFTGSTRVLANVIESEYSERSVTVITINNKEGFLSTLENVKIISICYLLYDKKRIPLITPVGWRIHALILALIYGIFYDTFYINTITPYYAAVVGFLYRKKNVYHVHEKFVNMNCDTKIAEYLFNHILSDRIFVSNYVKEQYPIKQGCKSIVKYNTLPKSFLSGVNFIPPEKRKRNSIIMITSLTKNKGIFTYIELARNMPDLSFRLIVSADRESIVNFINSPIPNNLEIIPTQSDIHLFLNEADLILNLSIPELWIETFGMTILEAMAYGIPSIVPNVGGPIELVIDGYNGYCIDVTNLDEIASTMRALLEYDRYLLLSRNSLERVKLFV